MINMYALVGILIVICVAFACLQFYRRKKIICKINRMDCCEKACLLNKLLEPFGFCYLAKQDIITSRTDAWQRQFGYLSLFDRTACRFQIVFECEPIYFYYEGKTYLIELWKGQYGINIGAEAGIYYADGCLPPEQFQKTHFKSVPDAGMLKMGMSLYEKGQKLFDIEGCHWWLTGFCMGKFCWPEDLSLWMSITFPNHNALCQFVEGLSHIGYPYHDILTCDLTVSFCFSRPHSKQPRCGGCWRAKWAQWKNQLLVKLFLFATKPFICTMDRLLYLYYFLPRTFRRILSYKKNHRQKKKQKAVHTHGL